MSDSSPVKSRNSRYAYGRRRSRSLGGLLTSELCKTIDKEKPPQKRLKLLVEYALKNAYNIALREFGLNSVDIENVEDSIKSIDSELTKNDVYNSAVSGDESFSDKKFEADNIAEYNEEMANFEEEIKDWNELVTTQRLVLKDLVKDEASAVTFKGTFNSDKYKSINYKEVADEVSFIVGNFNYQLDQISSSCAMMDKYIALSHKSSTYLNKEAETKFSETDKHNPISLIQRLKRKRVSEENI